MAPEKTDIEENDGAANTSTVSIESTPEVEREPYFVPVVSLPQVQVKSNEEEEEQLLKLRCKLFRYHNQEMPPEWKERGTGDVKILHHLTNKKVRLLMRQDKTLKVRANHYISPFMELKPNCNSDRAWVWSVRADFADEEPKQETFAIKFANSELANIFKDQFNHARGIVTVATVKEIEVKQKDEEKDSEVESKKCTDMDDAQKCLEKLTIVADKDLKE